MDAVFAALKRHLAFVGPGVIASVAYLDPGNWVTDLAAGSEFGYSHLFIILLAGLMALLFQILSTRLGCVSDYDLAVHCRFALYDRPGPYKLWYRWGLLYPLYLMAEAGIIMTDLAELLGSAIAINLLVPAIPLWACVLLTSLDVFLILMIFNQYPTRTMTTSMRMFELLIGLLVLCVLGSFVAMLVKVGPDWGDAFKGYLPSSGIINNGAIYIAVGIIGATVMPHAFYIGSKMACMRRLKPEDYGEEPDPEDATLHPLPAPPPTDADAQRRRRSSLACVRAHLTHACLDVAGSLLGFALVVNSAILILGAAVFYYGDGQSSSRTGVSDLFDAYDLIKQYLGQALAYVFAVALLAAGQSASLTVTLSGQIVSEGMIRWRTKPWKRRLVTRCIGIIPSLAVAVSVGRHGIDALLVGSQVALSIVLTFVLIPLIIFTSQHSVMSVPVDKHEAPSPSEAAPDTLATSYVSYANSVPVIYLCCGLWWMIGIANVYALYQVANP
ncbi:natural resistance-associated macrophage protein [Rhodotorula sp. JG-1b]|nr:natural resistance-associated macrophage protein [Rhodotorula sp. JG-1b]